MNQHLWVYTPHKNKAKALEMGKTLIKEKLIACTNIIEKVTSIYEWEGEIVEESEVLMIMKTKHLLFDELQTRIEELHTYSCPCIIGLPVMKGNASYLNWLDQQTKSYSNQK